MLERLSYIPKTNLLKGKRIIITGCGYKPLSKVFTDVVTKEPSHDSIEIDGKEMKLNIGSAITGVLARNGAIVHMISTSPEKLENIKVNFSKIIEPNLIEYSALDLLNESDVNKFVEKLPRDKPIYWVQSVGLGAGSYKLKDDNPYLPLEKIDLGLIEAEILTVIKTTHIMMKALLPIFKKQKETRIAIVTSMSAIRGYPLGATHCASKGAISRYTNSAMLSLFKENIFITDIRPGAVDTGMYDNKHSTAALIDLSKNYGGNWTKKNLGLAPPISVGEAINYVLTTPAHITCINLVAKGQIPNEGS